MLVFNKSQAGLHHLAEGRPCQDRSEALDFGWGSLIVVADGLGSKARSDEGAQLAVETLVGVVRCMPKLSEGQAALDIAKAYLHVGFCEAFKAIERQAAEVNGDSSEFMTTLTACWFNGRNVCWGHAGDGSLYGVTSFGSCVKLTEQQNDGAKNIVRPLQDSASWVFGSSLDEYCAVIASTDGFQDLFEPQLLAGELYERLLHLLIQCDTKEGKWVGRELAEKLFEFKTDTDSSLWNSLAAAAADGLGSTGMLLGDDLTIAVSINPPLTVHVGDTPIEPDWEMIAEAREAALLEAQKE